MDTFEGCIWLHLKGIEKEFKALELKRNDTSHPMPINTYNNLWYRLVGQKEILYRILSGHANPINEFSPMFDYDEASKILQISYPPKQKRNEKIFCNVYPN